MTTFQNNNISVLEAATQPHGAQRRAFQDVTNAGRFANAKGKNNNIVVKSSRSRGGVLTAKSDNKQVAARAGKNSSKPSYRSNYSKTTSSSRMSIEYILPNGSIVAKKPRDPPHDIDEHVRDDPFFVSDYVEDMYTYYREKETTVDSYMEYQPQITQDNRSMLVDWLVEVHTQINSWSPDKLSSDTLFLSINLVDRFLERQIVPKSELQLVGATAIIIASKYEDIYPPSMDEIAYLADNAFTAEDLVRKEEHILKTLDYKITVPTSFTFFNRFIRAAHADDESNALARFLLTGTLLHYSLVSQFTPSLLAAASVWLTRHNQARYNRAWSPTLEYYAGYTEQDVVPAARAILEASEATSYNTVANKFDSAAYFFVARKNLKCEI